MLKNKKNIWSELFIFILGLFFSWASLQTQALHYDNVQIWDKAIKLAFEHQWSHFGNEASRVGKIPGSFLTAITGVPLFLFLSPLAPLLVLVCTQIISYFLLRKVGSGLGDKFHYPYFALFFWLNSWRVEQSEFYNPAYLFLFASLHLYTFTLMKEKKFIPTLVHFLLIGFCFQIHLSAIILLFASCFLWLFRKIKIQWFAFFCASLIIFLSLIPYFYETLTSQTQALENSQNHFFLGRNFILVYPVMKAIIYFFRMASFYFGTAIFSDIDTSWISFEPFSYILYVFFHILKWIFASVSLFFSTYVLYNKLQDIRKRFSIRELVLFKNSKEDVVSRRRVENNFLDFENYFALFFLAMIVSACLSPTEFNHWHLIICFPTIAMAMVLYYPFYFQKIKNSFLRKYVFHVILITFVIWNTLFILGSRSHSWRNNFVKEVRLHYKLP